MRTNHTIKVLSTPVPIDDACHQITNEKPAHTSRRGAVNSRQTQVIESKPSADTKQIPSYILLQYLQLDNVCKQVFQDVFSTTR